MYIYIHIYIYIYLVYIYNLCVFKNTYVNILVRILCMSLNVLYVHLCAKVYVQQYTSVDVYIYVNMCLFPVHICTSI